MSLAKLVAASLCVLSVMAVTSPYPFRSGYGLGSWIEPVVILGMKKEAALRSTIVLADRMGTSAESVARELQLAAHPVVNKQDSRQTIPSAIDEKAYQEHMAELTETRKDLWTVKLNSYSSLWKFQKAQIAQLKEASKTGDPKGAPTTFAASVASPVNFALSTIVYQDRGFDSITVNANVIKADINSQKSSSRAHSASVAASVAAQAQDPLAGGGGFSSALAAQASAKTSSTMQMHTIEYTLILTAMATHRKVKMFKSIVLDAQRLRHAWNYYHPDKAVVDPSNNYAAFLKAFRGVQKESNPPKPDEPKISMVSEAYLGSALLGMVHFIQQDETTASESSQMSSSAVKAALQVSNYISSFTSSTSASASAASKLAASASQSDLDVRFDIMCMGYIPTLKSNQITQAIKEFGNFDPSTMGVTDLPQSDVDAAAKGQSSQQSSTGSIVKATLEGLQSKESSIKILDVETFMTAFDDYTNAAKTTEYMGVPVGLNVEEFTEMDVYNLLAEKFLPGGKNSKAGTEEQSTDAK